MSFYILSPLPTTSGGTGTIVAPTAGQVPIGNANGTYTPGSIGGGGIVGTLPTANGGTGLGGATPFTANGVVYASSASVLATGSALTFDASGNLGVGTTSPTANRRLDAVISANASAGIRVQNTNTGTNVTSNTAYVAGGNAVEFGVVGNSYTTYGVLVSNAAYTYVNNAPVTLAADGTGYITFGTGAGVPERARIDSSGNLGIGTSSPTAPLTIQKASSFVQVNSTGTGATYARFNNSGGPFIYAGVESSGGASVVPGTSAYSAIFGTDGAYSVQFFTNNSVRATLDSSGNLGLGVTPSAWLSSIKTLQIGSTTFIRDGSSVSVFGNNYYTNSSSQNIYSTTNFATAYSQNGGQHQWFNAPSGTAGNAVTLTQAMTLDASGNLGVGTTSPSASAILDAQSTTKGVRMPNMTTAQKNAIASPAAGLMVFDTTLSKLCVYSGAAWQTITSI
jgi:hypothetical protein